VLDEDLALQVGDGDLSPAVTTTRWKPRRHPGACARRLFAIGGQNADSDDPELFC